MVHVPALTSKLATWLCRRRRGGRGRPGEGIRRRQSEVVEVDKMRNKRRKNDARENQGKPGKTRENHGKPGNKRKKIWGGGKEGKRHQRMSRTRQGEHILERKSMTEKKKDNSKNEKKDGFRWNMLTCAAADILASIEWGGCCRLGGKSPHSILSLSWKEISVHGNAGIADFGDNFARCDYAWQRKYICVWRSVCHARFSMEDMHATFNVKALSAIFVCIQFPYMDIGIHQAAHCKISNISCLRCKFNVHFRHHCYDKLG